MAKTKIAAEYRRCDNCFFARYNLRTEEFNCQRNAPVAVIGPAMDGRKYAQWPTVEEDDWCGEWKSEEDEGGING